MKLKDEWADDIYGGSCKGWLRKGTIFEIGDKRVILSVQASENHHSTPQKNWVRLDWCSEVEIALVNDKYKKQAVETEPYFFLPGELGIEGFDDYFSYGNIGAYVPIEVVEDLADELAKIGKIIERKEAEKEVQK